MEEMPYYWINTSNPLVDTKTTNADDLKYEPICAAISPKSIGSLKIDNKKDFAFCVGIDELHHPVCAQEPREEIVANDAIQMSIAFVNNLGLTNEQVKISIASNESDDCTKHGLHTSFLACAEKVGENGNFIFYFAGHGFEWRNRCVLMPADFNKKGESGISGDELVQWLNDSKCKAKNVLFIFDCCYAGSLGETLTCHNRLESNVNLFAMCGCAAKEKLSSIGGLEHSIFAFFLLEYLKKPECKGEIKIEQAIGYVAELCFILSSLIMIYDHKEKKLRHGTFTPRSFQRIADIRERCVVCTPTTRGHNKDIEISLMNRFEQSVRERPHQMVQDWLQFTATTESLSILAKKVSSSKRLQKGIVSALLHSSALLQYIHEDPGKSKLEKKNLFLQIAIRVSKEITFFNLKMDHMKIGLEHYIEAVKKLKINPSELYQLHDDMYKQQ